MRLLPALLCAAVLLAGGHAWAASSPDEAAAAARQETGGRVLSVDRLPGRGLGEGGAWRVKVLTPRGEVRVVLVPVTRAGRWQ